MLKLLLRLALRNARRHGVRTLLTVGMVTFGVALLLVAISWVDGMFGNIRRDAANLAGHVRVVTPGFAERERLMPLHENIADVEAIRASVASAPGVGAAYAKISTGVTVTVGEEIGDVFALAVGADRAYFDEYMGAKDRVVQGKWFSEGPQEQQELVLGRTVVEQAGAKVGDDVVVMGMTQYGSMSPIKGTLVGIIGGSGALDKTVLVPLQRMQWLGDMEGAATEILVFSDDYQTAPQLAASLRKLPSLSELKVEAWSQREPWAALTKTVDGVGRIIVFMVVFLTSLGIWNTMMMNVLERTREIGVLRAMGLTRAGTVLLFLVEALTIGVLGGLAGVVLGFGPAWALQEYGISLGEKVTRDMSAQFPIQETVYGNVTFEFVVFAFVLGLVTALVGSVLPALRAAGIQPVAAMRSGR